MFPIQEMLLAAALFTPSPMDTTFLITGASVQVAAAKPAVATPAVGSTFRRMTGLAGTAAKAREAGLAICNHKLNLQSSFHDQPLVSMFLSM